MKQKRSQNSLLWSLLPRRRNGLTSLLALALLTIGLTACSITNRLPAGEVLYTGVSKINHNKVDTVDDLVKEALTTKLEVAPNSSFLGSAYHISPFPIGLWIYNGLYPKREKHININDALNNTLSRTFSTSMSTFVVLLAIFIFGGETIQGFVFALLMGVIVGTYSSLFIASPIAYDIQMAQARRAEKKAEAKK